MSKWENCGTECRVDRSIEYLSNSFEYDGSIIIRESYQFKLIMISAMIFGAISISAHYKSLNYGIFGTTI